MKPDQRGSRTFLTAVLLSLTGGYLDAYTYFVRGGVFANAQTGNVIKLGIALAQKQWVHTLEYLLPIAAFMIGVFLSMLVEDAAGKKEKVYSRRAVLAIEIACMLVIAFLPQTEVCNVIANTLVSLLCAMQMQTFQIFRKQGIATTVATGNLRKAVECLYLAAIKNDRSQLKVSLSFMGIILLFITGVITGTVVSSRTGTISILIPALLLTAAILHITNVYRKYSQV